MAEKRLTAKQQAFINAYVQCWNATEAARRAGYAENSARQQGSRLLTNVVISDAIQERIAALTMKADEALILLSEIARSTMADFLDPATKQLDLVKAEEAGKLHLIRKFARTVTEKGDNISIELYDRQTALVQILKELHLKGGEPTEHVKVSDARERLAQRLADQAARSQEAGDYLPTESGGS